MNTNDKGGVHTTVRVAAGDHKRLQEIAAEECRTVSAEVRLLITKRIAEADERDAKQAA